MLGIPNGPNKKDMNFLRETMRSLTTDTRTATSLNSILEKRDNIIKQQGKMMLMQRIEIIKNSHI